MNYNLIDSILNEESDFPIFVSNKEYNQYNDDDEHRFYCSANSYIKQIQNRKLKVSSDANSISV